MNDKSPDLLITPETKVGALLDQFPKLEETLIELSPQFAKLRSPLLRRTVAKVATLQQIAKVGDVPLGKLINTLRQAAGLDGEWRGEAGHGSDGAPEWMTKGTIAKSFDARPILEAGEHPMAQVIGDLKELKPQEVYEFITPFLPAPLLDMIRAKGYLIWSRAADSGVYHNYVTKP